jgi:hypothetical protein
MGRSGLGYTVAIRPINWVNRAWWIDRRCASERAGRRCTCGRKKARASSKTLQKRAAVVLGLNPPIGP